MSRIRIFQTIIRVGSVLVVITLVGSLLDLWRRHDFVEDRRRALAREEEENKRLKDAYAEAQTPQFVEKQARDKLGLVREGETVVIVDNSEKVKVNSEKSEEKNEPNWKQWIALFL